VSHSKARSHHMRQKEFPFYYWLLNKEGMLSVQKLAPKEKVTMILTLSKVEEGDTPKWWQAYYKTKPGLPGGAYRCALENVLNGIGALRFLHDISNLFCALQLATQSYAKTTGGISLMTLLKIMNP
jgi:hypothetical protein